MLIKDGKRKVSVYQVPALCPAFQNYPPMESLQQCQVGVLAPIFKKRQLRFREIMCLPKVIKPQSGQARA